jgi:hypothetical protein
MHDGVFDMAVPLDKDGYYTTKAEFEAKGPKKMQEKVPIAEAQDRTIKQYTIDGTRNMRFGEKVSFGGLEARWVATLERSVAAKATQGSNPYKVFTPNKTQKMVYSKGKPVYELVDSDGNIYVMQAHDARFSMESLPKLGEQLKKLPEGWQYRTRILTEDLVLDLGPDQTIYAVGDEFHQYYTRIRKTN